MSDPIDVADGSYERAPFGWKFSGGHLVPHVPPPLLQPEDFGFNPFGKIVRIPQPKEIADASTD